MLDVRPLRAHREFRLLVLGQMINNLGSMATQLALPFQLYLLTHSALALGALATTQLAAMLIASPLAGAIADTVDRRKLLLYTQSGLCSVSVILTILAVRAAVPAWPIYVLAFIQAVLDSCDRPARQSLVPRLVSEERLGAAIALQRATMSLARVLGPALGGVLIASVGLAAAYGVDALTFVASFVALALMPPVPAAGHSQQGAWRMVAEGLAYVKSTPTVLAAFVVDLDAMIFGMPTSLFPILAIDVFHMGSTGLGLLTAAPSFGSIVGLALSGWVHRVRYQGRLVFAAVGAWGVAITLFGLVKAMPLAMLLLAIAGAADVISAIVRATIIQTVTPDRLRGRVSALNTMVVGGGPKLGAVESTAVAAISSAPASVVSGGVLCLLGLAAVARWSREFLAYDSRRAVELPVTAPPLVPAVATSTS